MFGGGSYEEVARWLRGFVTSHAKRDTPRVEAIVETGEARAGKSFGVRLRLGEIWEPPLNQPAVELSFPEVAAGRGSLAWCQSQGARVRGWARLLLEAQRAARGRRAG